LRYYHGSPYKALSEIYPDYDWLPWKFEKLSTGYFNRIENRYRYIQWLSQELLIRYPEQWYGINAITLQRNYYGESLMRRYGDSIVKLMIDLFPEYDWHPWRFEKVPVDFWKSKENVKNYTEWLSNQLNILHWTDWSGITVFLL
jgi:hypothetical protein